MKRTLVAPAQSMPLRNLLLLFFAVLAASISAQSLSVQGVLTKADGTAVDDGPQPMTFRLWDAPNGGVKVHEEFIANVETTGGVYSVVLGQQPAYPLSAAFDKVYYLGVSIGSSVTELLPRPLMTHAPYALSLLGQNNQFPSVGTVSADAIKVPGGAPDAGFANKGYSFGTGGDPDGGLFSLSDNNVCLYANGVKALEATNSSVSIGGALNVSGTATMSGNQAINGNLTVGGTTNMSGELVMNNTNIVLNGSLTSSANSSIWVLKPLEIFGSINYSQPLHNGNDNNRYSFVKQHEINDNTIRDNYPEDANISTGLKVANSVVAKGFFAVSDRRIKKDFTQVSTAESLSKLLRFRVTDYRFVDEIASGRGLKTGFVAQEVEEIEPQAVSKSTGFLPSIYAAPAKIQVENGQITLSMAKAHDLKTGDRVRIFEGAEQHDLTVEAATETNFTVANWKNEAPEAAFVFGKEVPDFRAVDYDHIFTMNVAATQELARRLEILENENAALRAKNAGLENRQTEFEGQLSELARRMKLLENTGMGSGRK